MTAASRFAPLYNNSHALLYENFSSCTYSLISSCTIPTDTRTLTHSPIPKPHSSSATSSILLSSISPLSSVTSSDSYASSSICNSISNRSPSHFRIQVKLKGQNRETQTAAMIDSGASGLFINESYAQRHSMTRCELPQPIQLFNIDGSGNSAGSITHFIRLLVTPE